MSILQKFPLTFVALLLLFVSPSLAAQKNPAYHPYHNVGIDPDASVGTGPHTSLQPGNVGIGNVGIDDRKDSSNNREDSSKNKKSVSPKAGHVSLQGLNSGSSAANSGGAVPQNISSTHVQVEPFTGAANLSIPIATPPGRAGIQPAPALSYSSSNRQPGLAGVGWTLDLGSIQISTKKGVPKYDGSDIFTLIENGSSQDLVYDSQAGFYRTEVEGAFARIQKFSDHWEITDKKGIKYYFGNTDDSRQYDSSNAAHVFRWALNKVEDLNGNYMTISYLRDQGQIYPQTIYYTGNDTASLILSTYAWIRINYVAASTPSTSYISGFMVKTAQRIDNIVVGARSNVQSTYTFGYKQSAYTYRDVLQSIQQIGSDGTTTLPAITFGYTSDTAAKGFQRDTSWDLGNVPAFSRSDQHYIDLGMRVADLNGDGYPDFVRWFYRDSCPEHEENTGLIQESYINDKNKGWHRENIAWLPNRPWAGFTKNCNGYSTDTGVRLIDLDGDGLVDAVRNLVSKDSHYNNAIIQNQDQNHHPGFRDDESWYLPIDATIARTIPDPPLTQSGGTVFGDLTGSGYTDVAVARNDWSPSHNIYLNKKELNINDKGWVLSSRTTPSNVDFTKACMLIDINGDGLADIVCFEAIGTFVYLNTGSGWQEAGGYENLPAGVSIALGTYTQLIDVNGSGLPALVTAGEGSQPHVLINTGYGWVQDDSWQPDKVSFTDYSTQFLDADANGMIDYMVNVQGQAPAMYMNRGQPADLLTHIANGIGGSTDIAYDSSAHYQNTFMPFIEQVVKSVTVSDGQGHSYTTNYSYANGNWDATYREFQGFATVKVMDAQGNYTTTTFAQDHWLKGHPLEQDTYDASGNLYAKTVNQWQTQDIASNTAVNVGGSQQTSKFVYLARTDNYLYDASSTAKRTAQEFTYGENPQYGDVTQIANDGEADPDSGNSIDANKTITTTEYVDNTDKWLVGLPKHVLLQDVNGKTISQTWFYYDGDATGTATPALGHLTSKVNWLGISGQADPKTTYTYDDYGNLKATTDPNGNPTTIVYENDVHMFPVQTINALNQKVSTAYYGINDIALDDSNGLHGLWGQTKSTTDANNQTAYSVYDVFGRSMASISPKDSVVLPTTQVIYQIFSNYTSVTTKARMDHGQSPTIDTVDYYDGLGRLMETKSLGPNPGQYIVSGQQEYNNRGLPIKHYQPRLTSNDLSTLDSIDTSVPNAQTQYDALGRVVKTINSDGTYANVVYDHWRTTTIDENGHMQKSYSDAFGRLIQKEEYLGADGRAPDYPASAYSLYATTTYKYDPKGNLIQVADNRNNITKIQYDNLGRKVAMDDPDMGHWEYGYDGNGNLIWQKDAKGQTIRFSYDALNRLLNKTDGIPSGPINNFPSLPPVTPSFNVAYHYDDPNPDASVGAGQSFGQGRLGSVSYDRGVAGFTYDQLGRETASSKAIDGKVYKVSRQYDALNRLKQLQYPDGAKVGYTYNQAGQVQAIYNPDASVGVGPDRSVGAGPDASIGDPSTGGSITYHGSAHGGMVNTATDNSSLPLPKGAGSYVSIPASDQWNFGHDPLTIDFWVNFNRFHGSTTVFSQWQDRSHAVLDQWTSHSVQLQVYVNGVLLNLIGEHGITAGGWHHVAYIRGWGGDVNGWAITIDGKAIATASADITWPNLSAAVDIGDYDQDHMHMQVLDGLLSEFRVSKAARWTSNFTPPARPMAGGTATGNSTIGTSALILNGSDYVSVPASPDWDFGTGKATIDFWMYATAAPGSSPMIIGKQAGANKNGWQVMYRADSWGGLQFLMSDAGGNTLVNLSSGPPLALNSWYHIAIIRGWGGNANQWAMTINGRVVSTAEYAGAWVNAAGSNVDIGKNEWPDTSLAGFQGSLEEMRISKGTARWRSNFTPPAAGDSCDGHTVLLLHFDSAQESGRCDGTKPMVGKVIDQVDYNAAGQITQIQYSNGTATAYTYDPLTLRLKRIYTSSAQAQKIQDFTYTYDALGQITSITDAVNTATQQFKYDELNRLIRACGSYGCKTYAYDEIGNITQKDGLTYNYAESNSQLDTTGKPLGQAGPHAVTSLSDGTVFKYDANGNMVSVKKAGPDSTVGAGELTAYAYDVQNRLLSVSSKGLKDRNPQLIAQYAYDGDGGRTKRIVYRRDKAVYNLGGSASGTLFEIANQPYNPGNVGIGNVGIGNVGIDTSAYNQPVVTRYVGNVYEEESNGSTNRKTRFIYLGATRVAAVGADGSVYYYHADHLGGTNVLTDQSGLARELTEYDPFGQVVRHEKYGSDFATAWYYFTGKPLDDETGLIFLGARYYNPSLGRFITPDTVVPAPSNPQNLNRYSYCGNNPVNFTDPSGHKKKHHWWRWIADVGLAIVAVAAVVLLPVTAPGIIGFMSSVAAGAASGAAIGGFTSSITGGHWGQGVLTGAIGGAIFGGIGHFGLTGFSQTAAHAAGGAASGAINSEITGGNVGINALVGGVSAGVSQWVGQTDNIFKFTSNYITDVVKQATLGGIMGGATSAALGGRFESGFINGAEMSAIAYTANDWPHDFANGMSRKVELHLSEQEKQQIMALAVGAAGIEDAGAVVGSKITGYTWHGLNQAISRDGGNGVAVSSILDAVRNPVSVQEANGVTKYVGNEATVVTNNTGKVITTYGRPRN